MHVLFSHSDFDINRTTNALKRLNRRNQKHEARIKSLIKNQVHRAGIGRLKEKRKKKQVDETEIIRLIKNQIDVVTIINKDEDLQKAIEDT